MSEAAPMAANRTLPLRRPNREYRQREYLTEAEVEKLIDLHASGAGARSGMLRRSYSRIGTAFGRRSYARCGGRRLISPTAGARQPGEGRH
jgi:hypothetical protein